MTNASAAGQTTGGSLPANVLAEYRLSPRYRQPGLFRLIGLASVTIAVGIAIALGAHTKPFAWVLFAFLGVVALYNGGFALWRGRFCTTVRLDGIAIRGYFNHFVPWRDIQGVWTSGYGPARPINDPLYRSMAGRRYLSGGAGSTTGRRARLATVRVVRTDGHPMLLRAPLVTAWAPDPEFDNKMRELQKFCQQYAAGPRAK
jgi:uncharacterized membrane protein YphA (DoxX/SURF4 family)